MLEFIEFFDSFRHQMEEDGSLEDDHRAALIELQRSLASLNREPTPQILKNDHLTVDEHDAKDSVFGLNGREARSVGPGIFVDLHERGEAPGGPGGGHWPGDRTAIGEPEAVGAVGFEALDGFRGTVQALDGRVDRSGNRRHR